MCHERVHVPAALRLELGCGVLHRRRCVDDILMERNESERDKATGQDKDEHAGNVAILNHDELR